MNVKLNNVINAVSRRSQSAEITTFNHGKRPGGRAGSVLSVRWASRPDTLKYNYFSQLVWNKYTASDRNRVKQIDRF